MDIVELTKKLIEFETVADKQDQIDKAILFIKDFFKDTKLNIEEFENKGKKSLGLLFFVLAKEYLKNRGLLKDETKIGIPLEEFTKE